MLFKGCLGKGTSLDEIVVSQIVVLCCYSLVVLCCCNYVVLLHQFVISCSNTALEKAVHQMIFGSLTNQCVQVCLVCQCIFAALQSSHVVVVCESKSSMSDHVKQCIAEWVPGSRQQYFFLEKNNPNMKV